MATGARCEYRQTGTALDTIDQGALWYRHQFTLHGLSPDAMATLVFDGVDYFAEVALNGKTLTRHEGYFSASRWTSPGRSPP